MRNSKSSNKLGLRRRGIGQTAQLAGSFRAEIWMERNGQHINAKSIMGVMMLAAGEKHLPSPSIAQTTGRRGAGRPGAVDCRTNSAKAE